MKNSINETVQLFFKGKWPNGNSPYKLAAFSLSGLFSVTQALKDCFGNLKQDGSTESINKDLSFEQFKDVIQIDKHIKLERKFGLL